MAGRSIVRWPISTNLLRHTHTTHTSYAEHNYLMRGTHTPQNTSCAAHIPPARHILPPARHTHHKTPPAWHILHTPPAWHILHTPPALHILHTPPARHTLHTPPARHIYIAYTSCAAHITHTSCAAHIAYTSCAAHIAHTSCTAQSYGMAEYLVSKKLICPYRSIFLMILILNMCVCCRGGSRKFWVGGGSSICKRALDRGTKYRAGGGYGRTPLPM